MTRKMYIVLIAVAVAAAMPMAAVAGSSGSHGAKQDYSASEAQKSAESTSTVDADMWPAGEAVETGGVPGGSERSGHSLIDTHYDPFNPNMREVDRSTGD